MPKRVDVDKGWIKPEIINPLTSRCLTINVPDDLYHQVAFWGNFQNLTYPNNWQGTQEEKAAISAVWTEILRTARENWMSGECLLPAKFRTNPTTGAIEYQPLGGESWETIGDPCACPDPDALSPQFNPEVSDPDAMACAIATNLIEYIWAKVGDISNQIEAVTDTISAADIIQVVIPPLYLISDQVMDAAVELVESGTLILDAWLTVDRKESHQEWWYCRLLEKEQPPNVEESDIDAYKAWFTDPLSPGAGLYKQTINTFKTALWQDRARIASYGDGNCVAFACAEWEYEFDFRVDNGGFSGAGSWVDGVGWQSAFTGEAYQLSITLEIETPTTITHIGVTGVRPEPAYGGAGQVALRTGSSWSILETFPTDAGEFERTWDGEYFGADMIGLALDTNLPDALPATIITLTLRGTGINPFI